MDKIAEYRVDRDELAELLKNIASQTARIVLSEQKQVLKPQFLSTNDIVFLTRLSDSKVRSLFKDLFVDIDGCKRVVYSDYVRVIEEFYRGAGLPVPKEVFGEMPVITRAEKSKIKHERTRGLGKGIQNQIESDHPELRVSA